MTSRAFHLLTHNAIIRDLCRQKLRAISFCRKDLGIVAMESDFILDTEERDPKD